MSEDMRATIAYIAGSLIKDEKSAAIYDRDRERFLNVGVDVPMPRVSMHDPEKGCQVKRSPDCSNFCLLDDKDHHVCLSVQGRLFDGIDHDSLSHFSGHVIDNVVSLYDYRKSDYFFYQF
ncbi:hypothetical protein [Geoalkalibacter subterraneus]|jgi:hypothetical protein|uniref:Uncharacterized protein n=1 Tax=Geoalkalibacter subterraneus TaxID=483547 RepID=A0A0B5FSJ6_9BACT|nr:hypothetical protein [Geoalkalibacter subterraneus]AJF06556.1 hypothetical protein GSUB_08305 [Geoalkalibacter subterraneus]